MDGISVIVPVHNNEKELHIMMDALLKEKVVQQILLIENGSTDNSKAICNTYVSNYKQVDAYFLEEGNVSIARNTGLMYARQKWICFFDADDSIEEGKLEEIISESSSDMIVYDFIRARNGSVEDGDGLAGEYFKRQKREQANTQDQLARELSLRLIYPSDRKQSVVMAAVWRCVFRREFLEEAGAAFNPELSIGEDCIFLLDVLRHNPRLEFKNIKLYKYRVNAKSVTGNINQDTWKQYEKFFLELLNRHTTDDEYRRIQSKTESLASWIAGDIWNSEISHKDEIMEEMKRFLSDRFHLDKFGRQWQIKMKITRFIKSRFV